VVCARPGTRAPAACDGSVSRSSHRVAMVSTNRVYHPRGHHLLAVGLADAGFDVVDVGFTAKGRTAPAALGVAVSEVSPPRRRVMRIALGPLWLLRAYRLRPSLVQVNSLELLPWAVLARALFGIPTLYDSREDYAGYALLAGWIPRRLRPVVSRIVGRVEPWLARRVDAVTTADAGTAERFRGGRSVTTVHNFPRRPLHPPDPREIAYDVVYHGTVSRYHVEQLVAVAETLARRGRTLRWCLAVLDCGTAERRRLERRLAESGLRGSFTLRYDVPHETIPSLLASCRLGLVPLPDEPKFRRNIPMKLFELLAAGKPAVVSDLPPIRELVGEEDCCALVPAGDTNAYADAIAALVDDDTRAEQMGERGRALIAERLNAETELRPYIDLCRHLIR